MAVRQDKMAEFLDYGGDGLMSQLYSEAVGREAAAERLAALLGEYGRLPKPFSPRGRSGAYRFIIARARKSGWLKSADATALRLTDGEREKILMMAEEAARSESRAEKIVKRAVAAVIGAAIAGAFAAWAVWEFLGVYGGVAANR